jgi:hypothetical protein
VHDESKFETALYDAVRAADARLLEAANGDAEALDFLTAAITLKFLQKVEMRARNRFIEKEIIKGREQT